MIKFIYSYIVIAGWLLVILIFIKDKTPNVLTVFKDFELFVTALSALFAASIPYKIFLDKSKREHEKEKDLFLKEKASLCALISTEFKSLAFDAKRLQIEDVFISAVNNLKKEKEQGVVDHAYDGIKFNLKDEILPIYKSSIQKLGVLEPKLCEQIVFTAMFIESAASQIRILTNFEGKSQHIDWAIYHYNLALIALNQAFRALEYTLPQLEEAIKYYSQKMTSSFEDLDDSFFESLKKEKS